jgi:hypothetical protein
MINTEKDATMKIDLHVCTTYTGHPDENPASPQEAIKIGLKSGLDGIVIADATR